MIDHFLNFFSKLIHQIIDIWKGVLDDFYYYNFRYKTTATQAIVEEFVDEIISYGAPISQLELDDCWETNYGDFKVCYFFYFNFCSEMIEISGRTQS